MSWREKFQTFDRFYDLPNPQPRPHGHMSLLKKNETKWYRFLQERHMAVGTRLPNSISLESELNIREKYWMTYKVCRPNSGGKSLKAMSHNIFYSIEISIRILSTLFVTSCESERSSLRKFKKYNRSTIMLGDQLPYYFE